MSAVSPRGQTFQGNESAALVAHDFRQTPRGANTARCGRTPGRGGPGNHSLDRQPLQCGLSDHEQKSIDGDAGKLG